MRDLTTNVSTSRQVNNMINYDDQDHSNGFSSILRDEDIDTKLD